MPRKPKVQPTTADVFANIAEGLKNAAVKPNVYGYIPHDKQEEFHKSQARIRQFIGGNRSGKTVAGAVEAVWWLTGMHPYQKVKPPPVKGRAVGVDFLQGVEKIIKPEIARWTPLSQLKGGSWSSAYDSLNRTLYFQNGSFLEFFSYEQELAKFAGTSRDFIWLDEEPPRDIFIENKMRTIDVDGRMWMTMTPVEGMTWTFDEVYSKAATDQDIFVVQVEIEDNTYLNQSEIDQLLSMLTGDERSARQRGKYVSVGGLIWKQFDVNKHILDPFVPPKDWLHFTSMDHGFNNPTAWGWLAVSGDGVVVVYDEHYEAGRVVSYHAKRVLEKEKHNDRIPAYRVGDPSIKNVDPITGTSVQLEYIENGVPIMPGNNDVRAGLIRVAGMFEGERPRLFITRNCADLLWEVQRYRWGKWAARKSRSEKNLKEEPHKKDDHACDMLRYAIMSRPQRDDGGQVPDQDAILQTIEASRAVPAVPEARLAMIGSTRSRQYDDHLGSEW